MIKIEKRVKVNSKPFPVACECETCEDHGIGLVLEDPLCPARSSARTSDFDRTLALLARLFKVKTVRLMGRAFRLEILGLLPSQLSRERHRGVATSAKMS